MVNIDMRCVTHVLNLIVREGMKELDLSIMKIRALVRYVRSSPARLLKFKACIKEEKLESKSLVCLNVETRWNSTFLMLESAIKFKTAFACLLMKDSTCYKELRKISGGPSEDDWKRVGTLLHFLNIFYDATLRLSGSRYVTCNSYVHEIYGTNFMINSNLEDEDEGIKNMARQMKVKYEKYYGNVENINVLVFVAVILDPRHKMTNVEWMVKDNYEPNKAILLISKIKLVLKGLFDFYASSMSQPKRTQASTSTSTSTSTSATSTFTQDVYRIRGERENVDIEELMTSKFQRDTGCMETSESKSELEKYLQEDKEAKNPNFDILTWWKDQQKRYPILHKIDKDVLAIPVSIFASESNLSMWGRVLDDFRTSLTPKMVEALVCTNDWLRTSHTLLVIEENLLQLEEMEEGMKDLTLE
ncbi:Zinc finger BED domain-containing protein RICESLEEPER 2 [Bienertia sinuspersici]